MTKEAGVMRTQFLSLLRQNFRFGRMPQSRTPLLCGMGALRIKR